ncbi:MAG: AMP-binding protein, partial [Candidatus Binatia bacterium]
MSGFNLADAFDAVAETCAAQEALVQGPHRRTWAELERRARNLAAWMVERGATRQGKVAIYTYTHPAYMEGVYAAMKAALVPVNVNYRYREEELRYLLDNADAEIVVVHEEFLPVLRAVAGHLPQLRGVLVIGEGEGAPDLAGVPGAARYDTVAERDRPAPTVPRSPDDHLFLYTG